MSSQRIGGKDFHFFAGGMMINAENITLSIEDSSTVAMTRGTPNGYVDGETKAQGDIEVDTQNFNLISQAAKEAGSWKAIKPMDFVWAASTGAHEGKKVEAFGCKLKLSEVINIDSKGGEKHKYKIPYEVTGNDFVHIDGIPYLSDEERDGIVQ